MPLTVPFTLASHITQMSGSVLLYKGFGSCSQGQARWGLKVQAHIGHMFTVCCGVPLPACCAVRRIPLGPDCSFITIKTQRGYPWLTAANLITTENSGPSLPPKYRAIVLLTTDQVARDPGSQAAVCYQSQDHSSYTIKRIVHNA